jgi:hypothetical protein
VHPFSLSARPDDSSVSEISQVSGDLGLALLQNLYKIANAHLLPIHQIQQTETCRIGKRSKQANQVE